MPDTMETEAALDLNARVSAMLADRGIKLKSDETVLWVGRPISDELAKRYGKARLLGIFVIFWTGFWCWGVLMGYGNWDRKAPPRPLAAYNVCIAICACCWMMPPGIGMLTAPTRMRRYAKQIDYVLTNRQGFVLEPGWFRRMRVTRLSLRWRKCPEVTNVSDVSGDIVMSYRSSWYRGKDAVGFIAIPDYRPVIALMSRTMEELRAGARPSA